MAKVTGRVLQHTESFQRGVGGCHRLLHDRHILGQDTGNRFHGTKRSKRRYATLPVNLLLELLSHQNYRDMRHALDPRFFSLFVNEAKIAVQLNHPNIVQVHDLGEQGGCAYIAMEYLHGRDLTRLVKSLRKNSERLPVPLAIHVVAEICRGLAYAHTLTSPQGRLVGLIHRDISPHNILVTFNGEVKIVDFGIARLMNSAQGHRDQAQHHRPGGGKFAYMSPEHLLGHALDLRTDIFATGIVLWELLAGHRLFDASDPDEKQRLVREARVPDPRQDGAAIDDELWRILQKALAREPADRYSNAAIFEEDLRSWLFHQAKRTGANEVSRFMLKAFPDERVVPISGLQDAELYEPEAALPSHSMDSTTGSMENFSDEALGRLASTTGERKELVVLLAEFELTADRVLDSEGLARQRYRVLKWLHKVVDRFDGIVQRAIDDEIVVFFGVPRKKPNDLQRAVGCALALQRELKAEPYLRKRFELAIGVHRGDLTIRPSKRSFRYVAHDDTMRLPKRLAGHAERDTAKST
ncbi:MAG TPA: hypothetical protein EYQ31_08175 [Candidatus Handelsmanbacteria bacterium]|nr:hypothetical protein [Candidatus Handelsmanbacteria bacterium]